jgi:mannosidase alpha-like ER degradation enhancer 3
MAIHGIEFMQEMIQISQQLEKLPPTRVDRTVQLVSDPIFGTEHFTASPAQFGADLAENEVTGELALAEPYNGCEPIVNAAKLAGRIGIVRRGDCMFQEKVRHMQEAGAIAVVIIGKFCFGMHLLVWSRNFSSNIFDCS